MQCREFSAMADLSAKHNTVNLLHPIKQLIFVPPSIGKGHLTQLQLLRNSQATAIQPSSMRIEAFSQLISPKSVLVQNASRGAIELLVKDLYFNECQGFFKLSTLGSISQRPEFAVRSKFIIPNGKYFSQFSDKF